MSYGAEEHFDSLSKPIRDNYLGVVKEDLERRGVKATKKAVRARAVQLAAGVQAIGKR